MRLNSSQRILQTLLAKAQELTDLLLDESGGDLGQAWRLWEAVKNERASLTSTSHLGGTMDTYANNKTPRFLTAEEYINLPPKPSQPYTSSPWEFNEKALTLDLYETTPEGEKYLAYQVDLERCTTPAEVLDWIMDNTTDVWEDDTRLASLVRDLYLYLGHDVCVGKGVQDIRVTVKANIAEANILRGRCSRFKPRKHQENPASS